MLKPFPIELQPVFRRLVRDDLDALMAIEEVSFPTPWSRRTYERELQHSNYGSYWVVSPGNSHAPTAPHLLAYGGMWHTGKRLLAETFYLPPDPDFLLLGGIE